MLGAHGRVGVSSEESRGHVAAAARRTLHTHARSARGGSTAGGKGTDRRIGHVRLSHHSHVGVGSAIA